MLRLMHIQSHDVETTNGKVNVDVMVVALSIADASTELLNSLNRKIGQRQMSFKLSSSLEMFRRDSESDGLCKPHMGNESCMFVSLRGAEVIT
jgi:hypothetical protein